MVERHPNIQHRWREAVLGLDVARKTAATGTVIPRPILHVVRKAEKMAPKKA
jgi:hypothetical protein